MKVDAEGITITRRNTGIVFQSEIPMYVLANRNGFIFQHVREFDNHYLNNPTLERFLVERNGITVVSTVEYFVDKFFTNISVILDVELDNNTLMNVYRTVVESISSTLYEVNAINKDDLANKLGNHYNMIFVACKGKYDKKIAFDLSLLYEVKELVDESLKKSLKAIGYPKTIIQALEDKSLSLKYIEDVAMKSIPCSNNKIHEKLQNEIILSLNNVTVVSLIKSILNLECDIQNNSITEINGKKDLEEYLETMSISISNIISNNDIAPNNKIDNSIIKDLDSYSSAIIKGLINGYLSNIVGASDFT